MSQILIYWGRGDAGMRFSAFLKKSLAKNFLKKICCVAILCISNFDLSNGLIWRNWYPITRRGDSRIAPTAFGGVGFAKRQGTNETIYTIPCRAVPWCRRFGGFLSFLCGGRRAPALQVRANTTSACHPRAEKISQCDVFDANFQKRDTIGAFLKARALRAGSRGGIAVEFAMTFS